MAKYLELGVLVTVLDIAFIDVSHIFVFRSQILNLLFKLIFSCSTVQAIGDFHNLRSKPASKSMVFIKKSLKERLISHELQCQSR